MAETTEDTAADAATEPAVDDTKRSITVRSLARWAAVLLAVLNLLGALVTTGSILAVVLFIVAIAVVARSLRYRISDTLGVELSTGVVVIVYLGCTVLGNAIYAVSLF